MTERTYESDLKIRIEQSSDLVEDLNPGTKERESETGNLNLLLQRQQDEKRIAIEAMRAEKEMQLQEEELKHKKRMDYAKLFLEIGKIGAYFGGGWIILKANMNIGNMSGRDAKEYFNEIKHMKLW